MKHFRGTRRDVENRENVVDMTSNAVRFFFEPAIERSSTPSYLSPAVHLVSPSKVLGGLDLNFEYLPLSIRSPAFIQSALRNQQSAFEWATFFRKEQITNTE